MTAKTQGYLDAALKIMDGGVYQVTANQVSMTLEDWKMLAYSIQQAIVTITPSPTHYHQYKAKTWWEREAEEKRKAESLQNNSVV